MLPKDTVHRLWTRREEKYDGNRHFALYGVDQNTQVTSRKPRATIREEKGKEKEKLPYFCQLGAESTRTNRGIGQQRKGKQQVKTTARSGQVSGAWPFLRRMHASNVLAFCTLHSALCTPSSVHVALLARTSFVAFFCLQSVSSSTILSH